MLFHSRIVALKKPSDHRFDRYGNPIAEPIEEIPFRGELIARDSAEPDEPNREITITSWRVLIPRNIQLGAHDKLQIHSDTYEITGTPMPIMVRGQISHYEANVQRTTG